MPTISLFALKDSARVSAAITNRYEDTGSPYAKISSLRYDLTD